MSALTDWQAPDVLSPVGVELLRVSPTAYTCLTPKEPGTPQAAALLERLGPDQLFTGDVRSTSDAKAALAGLWLYHDFLDESHSISQELHSPTGSFWHAIMHRREGDFPNAKYWYARCRHHPVLEAIPALAQSAVGGDASAGPLRDLVGGHWNPDAFVDVVEAVHRSPRDPLYAAAVRLQQLEWRALFDHCAKSTLGAR